MAQGASASVLRRKAGAGRAQAGAAVPAGPGKALADALRRAGEAALALAIEAGAAAEERLTPAELVERLPERGFLGLLEGPGQGSGLISLDGAALAALIEALTTGRVLPTAPEPRRATRTDAAILADLVDRILAEFEAPLIESEAARWASGWRYQTLLPDPRPLPVLMEDAALRVLGCDVEFAGGVKRGRLMLALPAAGRARPRAPVPPPDHAGEAAAWAGTLERAVAGAPARLDATLGRLRLPLAELARLAPGDRLALPMSALGAVRLSGPDGVALATGRLGQSAGLRALRLDEPGRAAGTGTTEAELIRAGTLGQPVPREPAGPRPALSGTPPEPRPGGG